MDVSILAKEPISPEHPAGDDVRYDPLFEQLQAEVDRASLPSVAGAVDWEAVVKLAGVILSSKSKDLLVSGYLAIGLIHTRGVEGLELGLTLQHDLLRHHGPALFPQRERARLRAVEWWLEKCKAALTKLQAASLSPAQVAGMEEKVNMLGLSLGELLPDAPSLQFLQHFLKAAGQSGPPPEPEAAESLDPEGMPAPLREAPESAGLTEEAPGTSVKAPATGQPVSVIDRRERVEEIFRRLRETAQLLLDQDLTNPLAYRFSRAAAWLDVRALPPATAGRTALPAPPGPLRERLLQIEKSGDHSALLKESEGKLNQFIFWLDLNRMTAAALTELGARGAFEAVSEETASLLRRLPEVAERTFADGTPFADAKTREWLRKECGAKGLAGAAGKMAAPRAIPTTKAEKDDFFLIEEEASARAGEGKLVEAMELLQGRIKRSVSAREGLKWRLALSRVLIDAGHLQLATPQLQAIVADIERFRLEAYDPDLALEGLKLAWSSFQAHDDACAREQANLLRGRIAILDPAEMFRLSAG